MKNLNLSKNTLAAVVVTLVMLAVAAASISFSASRRLGIEDLQQDAASRLRLFSGMIFAPADKYGYLPKLVSEYQAITDVLIHPQDSQRVARANSLLERINSDAGATTIFVLDLNGLTIASSNWKEKQSFVGNNYAFRPYFFDALKKGDGYFYAMGITTQVPGYYMSRAVKNNNVNLGVVVVKVDISELNTNWEKNEHEMMVTDENDVIFLSSQEEWKYRPLSGLSPAESANLKRTRQYEGVLKNVLDTELKEILSADERLVDIISERSWYGDEKISYFVKSQTLPGSAWAVHILTPLNKVTGNAWRAAIIAFGGIVLLSILLMYLSQLRIRALERNESRLALEQAHLALEQKHAELQALNEEFHVKSITDPLTGTYNRRFFMESMEKMISLANRHHYPLSVIMIDVDHFKRVNDAHGHPAGDTVLQTIAALYKEEMREADILARYGGEEFIIALPHADEEVARGVAERIRTKVMDHPIEVDGDVLQITISSGVSQFYESEKDVKGTIKRADQALYKAKHEGRNRVICASELSSGSFKPTLNEAGINNAA